MLDDRAGWSRGPACGDATPQRARWASAVVGIPSAARWYAAAMIGSTGQAGQGAAIGAGAGLLFGGLSGSNYTLASSSQLQ